MHPNRLLRVVVLPNKAWKPLTDSFRQGDAPDPNRLRRLMADRGIDFVVVDPFLPPYNPLGRSHPFFAGLDPARGCLILLKYRSVDLVISVFESGAVMPLLLRRLLFFKPPVALWDVSIGSQWRPRRLVLRFVLPLIDKVFVLSRRQKVMTEKTCMLRSPASVIGYAVDEEFYHPHFNGNAEHVLAVGDDVSRDYSTLVAAVKAVPAPVVLKTNLLPEEPQPSVRIIRERLSFVRLRDLYAAAIMVVIPLRPSDHPSGITSIFEAMAMGKPIIISDVPMAREFIIDGETGLFVPVGDVGALRDAIMFLITQPNERRRLGHNARGYLEENLSTTSFADRFAACIKEIARPGRTPQPPD